MARFFQRRKRPSSPRVLLVRKHARPDIPPCLPGLVLSRVLLRFPSKAASEPNARTDLACMAFVLAKHSERRQHIS